MAALLQKLLKKPASPPLRIFTSLNRSHPPDLYQNTLSPLPHQDPTPLLPCPSDRATGAPPLIYHPLQIYPTFPNWAHLGPISQPGFDRPDSESDAVPESGDDRTVRADSVKKKRKRKMNKHKYRKLRKCLRRKT